MAQPQSRWVRFKRFLKRNMTPTWAKHFSYQVFSFLVSVAMVIGVANYAITRSYDERKLTFVEGFTITAHTGAFDTNQNSLEAVQAAIDHQVEVLEIDVRQRPNGILVMAHDLVVKNSDGVPLADAFALLEPTAIRLNLDIKETKVLGALHDLLVEYNLYDRVILTGLEVWNMNAVKASTCRDLPYYLNYIPSRFQIFSADYQQRLLKILEESGAIGLNCNYKHVGGRLSNFLHKNGYKLSVWTVDRRDTMKRILVAKPDNITTKQYDKLQDVIARWGKNK